MMFLALFIAPFRFVCFVNLVKQVLCLFKNREATDGMIQMLLSITINDVIN